MKKLRTITAVSLPLILLSACGTASDYPSLTTRDSERISGVFETGGAPVFTPSPANPTTLAELAAATQEARAVHMDFMAKAELTSAPVANGLLAEVGSEEWSVAQLAVAELESVRNSTLITLANIDRLYVDTVVDGDEYIEIGQYRAQIVAIVEEQNAVIASLLRQLPG